MEEHYHVLQIPPDADSKAIKKAFRRMSLLNHPDKGGSDEAMAKINKANAVLGNKQKRERYDKLGVDWEDDDEEAKFAEESRVIMEPIGSYVQQIILGSLYIFVIQYYWTNVLLTIGGIGLIVALQESTANTRLALVMILAAGWLSRWGPWLFFFVEALVLWFILFCISGNALFLGVGGIISLLLAYWFSGRTFYYVCVVVLGVLAWIAIYILLEIFVAIRQQAAEQKLERYTTEIKPKIRAMRKEIETLKKQLQEEKKRRL
mmetsp:Transcript_24340/g.34037  ORF Transcript_24340/g.34037 Transcript_24340/m.34037 type:complete len:262 (-) Transcript_24340:165-950(-)|eukprot:CAMPEP_0185252026 /NCGR_PEP_ID=MMETSP1359-20130426/1270_1 /TAXON_ID=552665 /ORGANISM="Bigelowiella longifila, Strain CCMP242" /LENGTH=261 /DNA_ID=CAMNT_0027834107 /DNA_START=63 /DNA_END=848 /DNA_ORIENTATION=-